MDAAGRGCKTKQTSVIMYTLSSSSSAHQHQIATTHIYFPVREPPSPFFFEIPTKNALRQNCNFTISAKRKDGTLYLRQQKQNANMDAKCCSNSEKLEKYMAEVKENMAKERSKEEMDDSDFCEEFTMCLDSYIADVDSNPAHTTIIFTLKEEAGALAETLKVFKQRHVNLTHIESRPSKVHVGCYEFMVEFAQDSDPDTLESIIRMFRRRAESAGLQAPRVQDFNSQIKQNKESVPWFPMKISDIDQFANRVLSYGAELDSDHPGFTDPIYRARRKHFADIAANFRHGDKIPRVEYTAEEIGTWRTIYSELVKLYPSHACREFNYIFPLLQQNCGYGPDQIPQLQDVSDFLKDCTGFTLRPVAGLLSSRDFLAGLAFRVFHSTQYIRHSSKPHYTPEPDICHELLGHCPLYADPDFAQFSQEIGLASLGASDELVEKLATLYWFTVEFGICIQNGAKKAYGAGLLSSFGELEYALSGQPELASFDPPQTCQTKYPITSYQPKYFVAESFADAKNKLTAWTQSTARQFQVSYNPYTQRIEMLDNESAANKLVRDVKSQVSKLEEALRKLDRVKTK